MARLRWSRWRRDLVAGLIGMVASLAVCVPCSWAAIRREREKTQRNLLSEATQAALQFGMAVGASSAEIFSVETDAITPEVPKGAHLLIDKQTPPKAVGDIVVFRREDRTYLGRIQAVGQVRVS